MRLFRPVLVALVCSVLALAARGGIIEVEGPQDSLDGPPLINHCTLRKAIINANTDTAAYPQCAAGSGIDTIVFLSPMTISLTRAGIMEEDALTGDLDITESLIITGNDGGTTIDGAGLDRIFHINPHSAAGVTVTLNNLNLRNGHGLGGGGAIYVNGATLNMNGMTVSGSFAAEGDGGAVWTANSSTLNMTNCTISGNRAQFHAGAIVMEGIANITSSTITGNVSDWSNLTGGLRALAVVTLRNTIVAGNGHAGDEIPNLDGTFISAGYNIIGDLGTRADNPTLVPNTGDQIGVTMAALNLGPLVNNGGPTPTHALLAGSIAIDKGHSSASTADQRGLTRPCDLASVANATGGDGADVGAFEVQGACAGTNTDPVANADTLTAAEDSGANAVNVLANDTDAEGDTLTINAVTQGAHGLVVITGGGTGLTYSPTPDFNGSDAFTYTIDDGNGGTATGNVSVVVTPVNDDPDAVNDSATVNEDTSNNTISVLANDTDVDGDALVVTATGSASHGTVVNNGTSVTYTPAHDFFGSDSFTYTVSDGHGGFDTATVFVTVNNVNDPPVAAPDSYTINQDTTLHVAAPGALGNDSDVDGDALTAHLTSPASHGSAALNADGSFTYTPNAGFAGIDSFSYKANDGHADSNIVTVTIHVLDTQPPDIVASVSTSTLWPPNHDLVNVGFALSVSDNSGGAVTTSVNVFSDEDDVTSGGGDMSPDAKNIAPSTLRLRAERDATSDGRVYLIRVLATDTSSNTSQSCLTVVVPKSMSAADVASVNAQANAVRAACMASFVVGDGPVVGPKQ
jgi:hypothetical protein